MAGSTLRVLTGAAALGAASALVGRRLSHRAHGNGHAAAERAAIEVEIREANERFYTALDRLFRGDVSLMSDAWSHAPDVTLMDPFGGRLVGWRAVHAELARGARQMLEGRVDCEDLLIRADGEMAYAVGVERGYNIGRDGKRIEVDLRATSVFRREDGRWRMVHHHTDEAASLQSAFGGGR